MNSGIGPTQDWFLLVKHSQFIQTRKQSHTSFVQENQPDEEMSGLRS